MFFRVSIPFKRESISKVFIPIRGIISMHMFQFPSNGKVYPKPFAVAYKAESGEKIIEFQFPSNGKVYPKAKFTPDGVFKCTEFQFPSNGKVYPKKNFTFFFISTVSVSIPFKRESISKGQPRVHRNQNQNRSFNSLQTGKYIQRTPKTMRNE